MKSIIVKNLMIQFDSFDEGADQHTATATLDEFNTVLQQRFPDISPQIFVNAIDTDDIEIAPQDDDEELKPCPICGEVNDIVTHKPNKDGKEDVQCLKCGLKMEKALDNSMSAVEWWNTRK